MAANLKPRRTGKGRALLEWSASAPSGSPLTVDRARRVIEGVRVLGRFSKNSHGVAGATNGTEYTSGCMRAALPLYEDADVLADHEALGGKVAGLQQRRTPRGVEYVIGALRNARVEGSGDSECVRADLHYFESHPITPRLLEDVERALGRFGLSHDASSGRDRFDPASKRLVIESLAKVRSVDLVRKPATNRNLWESHEEAMPTTLREMLDERRPKLTKARRRWADRLLEDDAMAPSMDAPMDAPPAAGADPDDALWTGFMAAIQAIGESYKSGELSAKDAGKKVTDYLKAHESLTGDAEPEAPPADAAAAAADDDKTEAEKDELAKTKHKLAVRELCEELKVSPDKTLLESLESLPIDQGRKLVEREKARGTGGSPRGAGAHKPAAPAGAKKPKGAAFIDAISE